MRGAGMDFGDFLVCIFNFRTKLKIPNRFARGGRDRAGVREKTEGGFC